MRTWDDYKKYVSAISSDDKHEIEDCEELANILSTAIYNLYKFGLTNFFEDKSTLYNNKKILHREN